MKRKKFNIELNPYKGRIVSKSNELIEKRTQFTRNQERLFSVALKELQHIKGDEVHLDKRKLCEYLKYSGQNAFTNLSNDLSGMKSKSNVKYLNENTQRYIDVSLITRVEIDNDDIIVQFNRDLLPKLRNLSRQYTKYFQDDFCSFTSKMSMKLYERLMEFYIYADSGVVFTTEQLIDVFCLEKNAYKDSRGVFQRSNFEKRTIKVAVEEINEKTKCIKNLKYERVKHLGVVYYRFTYDYTAPETPQHKIDRP